MKLIENWVDWSYDHASIAAAIYIGLFATTLALIIWASVVTNGVFFLVFIALAMLVMFWWFVRAWIRGDF